MRSWWIIPLFSLLLATAPAPAPPPASKKARNRFVPPDGTCLLIIGQNKASIDDHVNKLKVRPAGEMLYTSLVHLEGLSRPSENAGAITDAPHLLKTYPNSVLQIGLYLVKALPAIVDGKHDDNIDKLGDWIKQANRPIYLRVGYEFDLPENDYAPDLYVKAFRRIRDRLDRRGVLNVAYVWHSYAAQQTQKAATWYPGDAYVDWVAVSYFSPKQQPYPDLIAQFAREHGKPLMIAEATPRGIGTGRGAESWEGWFVPCFLFMARNGVKAFCYIDCDWDASPRWQGWGDTRIAANEVVKKAWLKEIGAKRYLKASPELFKTLGYKPTGK